MSKEDSWKHIRLLAAGVLFFALSSCTDNNNKEIQEKPEVSISVYADKSRIGDIQSWVFAEGTARSVSREYLVFQNAGKITYLEPTLREGSVVKAGALLAQQDQRSLKADLIEAQTAVDVAQAEFRQAKTQATLAGKTFKRFEILLEQISASQQEFDEALAQVENAKADVLRVQNNIRAAKARFDQKQIKFEESELRAPIDGVVAYLNIEKGHYFMPNIVRTDSEEAALRTVPIVLIDPSAFEIAVDVPVYDRDRVQVGQTVLIQTRQGQRALRPSSPQIFMQKQDSFLKNRTGQTPPQKMDNPSYIRGQVYSVNPAVSPSGRSIQVNIRTDNNTHLSLKDGMYVTVWIATERHENVITAPLEAFLFRDNQPFVFVVNEKDNTAILRPVTLGLQEFDRREVVAGLKPGEWLVTEGRYQLSNGVPVKILGKSTSLSSEKPIGPSNE